MANFARVAGASPRPTFQKHQILPKRSGMRLGGDGAWLRRDTTEHETKPNHAVKQGSVPLLRETRKIPYSISKNDVTENRPLLQHGPHFHPWF